MTAVEELQMRFFPSGDVSSASRHHANANGGAAGVGKKSMRSARL